MLCAQRAAAAEPHGVQRAQRAAQLGGNAQQRRSVRGRERRRAARRPPRTALPGRSLRPRTSRSREATYEALKALNLQSVPETLLDLQTAFRSHFMTSTANLDTAEKAAFRDSCLRARRVLLALIRQRTAPISTR